MAYVYTKWVESLRVRRQTTQWNATVRKKSQIYKNQTSWYHVTAASACWCGKAINVFLLYGRPSLLFDYLQLRNRPNKIWHIRSIRSRNEREFISVDQAMAPSQSVQSWMKCTIRGRHARRSNDSSQIHAQRGVSRGNIFEGFCWLKISVSLYGVNFAQNLALQSRSKGHLCWHI